MISFRQINKRTLAIALVILVILVSALMLQPGIVPAQNPPANKPVTPLPTVQSMEHLRTLLSENIPVNRYMTKEISATDAISAPMMRSEAAISGDYSSTNVQVEGVDEADMVKTDGTYIYQINNGVLTITRAIPANKMQLMTRITFKNESFSPVDFYITDNKLILIGSGWTEPRPISQPIQPALEKRIVPPYNSGEQTTRAIVYDSSDKANLVKVRELELKGSYLTSRRIGQTLYLVSNNYLNYYYTGQEAVPLPAYKDSAAGTQFNTIPCEKIRYFPQSIYNSYIVTAALEIDQPKQKAQVDTYLGTAENVYASTNNLYIAIPAASNQNPVIMDSAVANQSGASTNIFRFSLTNKQVNYAASGSIPGQILNQFSMDEYGSFFRIATTTDKYTDNSNTTSNNIYVLDEALQMKGKIENIAPGELIYSARFMGNRVYLVTFRTVDPFFVIDLTNAAQPKILGKLKIPGYSNYLQPYDENHIIGFGKDTVETKGYEGTPQAYYLGMKIALFDVSDLNNPVEMDKVIIGDRGTDSELLNNHRALLFAKDKNLLAFPVTVAQVDKPSLTNGANSSPAYGSFAFQGAYVYNISLTGGLDFKGRITHMSQDDYLKAGDYWSDPNRSIQRILYIGNNLYTVSANMIQAHQIDDLKLIGSLQL